MTGACYFKTMTAVDSKTHSETPLMTQYHSVKAEHGDAVLFFRMGDFFEMFYEDAKIASKVLGLTLTTRGHGKAGDVPLAGFPHHALEIYLGKMIRAGYKVAICDQVEDPKLAKGIVKREVIQVATPGTLTEEKLLDSKKNNYLTAVFFLEDRCGIAFADVSTGEFKVTECPADRASNELESIGSSEILISEDQTERFERIRSRNGAGPTVTRRENWIFGRSYAHEMLTRHFGTASLKGFGCEDLDAGLSAAGAIYTYLKETQKNALPHIRSLKSYSGGDFMLLDAATRRNLEIAASMTGGGSEGTLLSILDRTQTPMGGRTLASWLHRPLTGIRLIRERLDAVDELVTGRDMRNDLVSRLKGMGDSERLIARIATGKAGPRDLIALKITLKKIPELKRILTDAHSDRLTAVRENLAPCGPALEAIEKTIVDDPPASLSDGGTIREGFHRELDELRVVAFSGKDWIARLQATERNRTGISSLKVGYNQVFGYYIEVTKPHLAKIPQDFIRKQTLVNAERFITPALKEMEEKILHAEEKLADLESRLFDDLRKTVAEYAGPVQDNSRLIGELDSLISFAGAGEEYRYVRPGIHEGNEIEIDEGRHPVVERLLPPGQPFIPNDVKLDNAESQVLIITGPNMAGKSTYIRQVGLIVLMAQIGCYVPAKRARIGMTDRIFTRVGAQDNVAGGESTFLVEMNETANILNNATPKSLVLLDEIGRGTSTFDGLSIAWAVAEFLHNHQGVQAKTLFATHYHELTELALILPRVKNYNVAVREWGDHIVFLRKIVPGGCDHSYGIQVARLAGLPAEVIARSKEILRNLEANELTPNRTPKLAAGGEAGWRVAEPAPQLDMFAARESLLADALKKLDLDSLTPLEALKKLDELKKMISE
jgi:DNA mismatch repair protein MutS